MLKNLLNFNCFVEKFIKLVFEAFQKGLFMLRNCCKFSNSKYAAIYFYFIVVLPTVGNFEI